MKTRFPSLIGAVLASAALFACDVADESAAGDPESTALLALAGDPELNLDELDREASPADVCSPERVRDHALNRQAQRQGAGGEQMGPPPEGGRGQMGPGGEGEGRMGPGGQGQARGGQEPGAGDQGEGRMGPPAERGEREGRPHGPRGPRGGLLAIYDLDGDGVLSDEEKATLVDDLTAGCEARLQRALDEFDAGGPRGAPGRTRSAPGPGGGGARPRRGRRRQSGGARGRSGGAPRRVRPGRRWAAERGGARGPARRDPRAHPQRRPPAGRLIGARARAPAPYLTAKTRSTQDVPPRSSRTTTQSRCSPTSSGAVQVASSSSASPVTSRVRNVPASNPPAVA